MSCLVAALATTIPNDNIIGNIFAPKPMCLPHCVHLFNRDVLRLRQKELNEESHDDDKASKEKEKTELHVAKHGKECLSDEEGEQHVNRDVNGLPS